MKRLVFDLRNNPGGALDQAIKVANRFLPRGDMVVYTRGRVPNSDQDYRATESERLPRHADGDAGQSQQRQRVGDRLGRAAGSRSLADRRRDDVRQGARAVGLSRQRGRRRRGDDGALLHAERPPDSAAVGRQLRRVPDLHAARAGSQQGAQPRGSEAHRRGPQGLQRRRRRAGSPLRRTDRRVQPDALRPHALRAPAVRHLRAALRAQGRHAHHDDARRRRASCRPASR